MAEQVIAEANFLYGFGVPTGSGDAILTDGSDLTYVTVTPGTSSGQFQFDLVGDHTAANFTNIRVEIEAESMGAPGYIQWGVDADSEPGYPGANYFSFGWDFAPTLQNPDDDGGLVLISGRRKYVQEITASFVYFHPEEWSVARFLNRVADDAGYQHAYGGMNGYFTNADPIRVYRFVVIAYTRAGAPPLRQFPRNDGLAGSARRSWPPPRSIQRSQRRAGGYL